MSYRGQPKGSYGNQKRGFSGGYPYSTKKQSKPFPIAKDRLETQVLTLDPQPTLWLYAPESFCAKAFVAELSNDPAILQNEVYLIAQVASKRKLEIVSKRTDEAPIKYKIIPKSKLDKPQITADSLPSENVNFLGIFQTRLEGLGFTVIPT